MRLMKMRQAKKGAEVHVPDRVTPRAVDCPFIEIVETVRHHPETCGKKSKWNTSNNAPHLAAGVDKG